MSAVISRFCSCCATVLAGLAISEAIAVMPVALPDQGAPQKNERLLVNAPSVAQDISADVGEASVSDTDRAASLQLSSELTVSVLPSDGERDLLRLAYRTMTGRDVQIDNQLALADMLLQMQRDMEKLKAAGQSLGVSIPASPSPPMAFAPVPDKVDPLAILSSDDARLFAALGVVSLMVMLAFIHRRRRIALKSELLTTHVPRVRVEAVRAALPGISASEHGGYDWCPPTEMLPEPAQIDEHDQLPDHLPVSPEPPPAKTEGSQVEELAEIILSVGRVPGADDALQKYIRSNPKQALQLWIRLLEIYRTDGKRPEFEKLSAMLNQKYNVECVPWDGMLPVEQLEMTLQLLPHIRDQVDASWGQPECLEYLLSLLSDNRDGERRGFSLPVTKELLILIDLMAAERKSGEKPASQ